MALYHFSVKVISRGSGRSAVAAAAYRAGEKIVCERDGLVHDYTKKQGCLHSEISLPEGAPQRWHDRSTLWNEVERIERRADAQLAREVEFALPHELDFDEQKAFCAEVVNELFVREGMVADWSIHDADSDGHNIHCHVMLALRNCDESGFLAKSVNVYTVRNAEGDERRATTAEFRELKELGWEKVYKYRHGNEFRELTASQAEEWDGCKRVSKHAVQEARYLNNWNDKENLEKWRERFCEMQNQALERCYEREQTPEPERVYVDCRTYEEQGIERVPQVHEGPTVREIERKAELQAADEGREYEPVTEVRAANLEVAERNDMIARIEQALEELRSRAEEVREKLQEQAQSRLGQLRDQLKSRIGGAIEQARGLAASVAKPERPQPGAQGQEAQESHVKPVVEQHEPMPAKEPEPAPEPTPLPETELDGPSMAVDDGIELEPKPERYGLDDIVRDIERAEQGRGFDDDDGGGALAREIPEPEPDDEELQEAEPEPEYGIDRIMADIYGVYDEQEQDYPDPEYDYRDYDYWPERER